MKMNKSKIILHKGYIIDYQTVLEEVIGPFLARASNCYKKPEEMTKEQYEGLIDKSRDYFVPDADYEIILRKKHNK